MLSPIGNVPSSSSSIVFSNIKSNDSPPTPSSYVSLLDTSQSSDISILSVPSECSTVSWSDTFNAIRQWSTRTFKFTRQLLQERIGHSIKTYDIELEKNILTFYETKRHYECLLKESRQMCIHFAALLQTQRSLSQTFLDLQHISTNPPDLIDQYLRNSQCQTILTQNGDNLLNSINYFVGNLQTLITKTMEDTLMTIKAFENARIEYDIYRSDYEHILSINPSGGAKLSNTEKHIERQYYYFKERYEKYKMDVTVKLRLIDDHRIKIMREQLILFDKAIGKYISSNQVELNF